MILRWECIESAQSTIFGKPTSENVLFAEKQVCDQFKNSITDYRDRKNKPGISDRLTEEPRFKKVVTFSLIVMTVYINPAIQKIQ